MATAYALFLLVRSFVRSSPSLHSLLLLFFVSCVFEVERTWDKSLAITHVIERFDAWTVSVCKTKMSLKYRSACRLRSAKCVTNKRSTEQTYKNPIVLSCRVSIYIFVIAPSFRHLHTVSHMHAIAHTLHIMYFFLRSQSHKAGEER